MLSSARIAGRLIMPKREPGNYCPKCGVFYLRGAHPAHKRAKSKHHVLPRRFYGKTDHTIELCRQCHDKLEKMIPFELQPIWFYEWIIIKFYGGIE
jgi:hypothetical protein